MFPGATGEHVGGLEAPVGARVQHQPPALDHPGLERGGDGRVPAGDPTVSVSEEQMCNFKMCPVICSLYSPDMC